MNQFEPALNDQLVATAQEVATELRPFEIENDRLRMLHPEAFGLLRDSGLLRAIQPRRIGGTEVDIPTLQAICRALTHGSPAAGWVYTVTCAHTWMLGKYRPEAQDELAALDPDTFLPGSLAAAGSAEPVEGGFKVSGRWAFASGCDHARWMMLGATQTNSTREDPKHVHVLVPHGEYAIDDTWHTLGMRGTGSKDILLDNVFVPNHRAVATGDLFETGNPNGDKDTDFTYSFPVLTTLTFFLTGPVLAVANRFYQEFIDLTRDRCDKYDGSSKAKKTTMQARVGESWAELESAELLVREIRACYQNARAQHSDFDIETRLALKLRGSYAMALCRRAVDRLFDAAGANAVYERSPLLGLKRNLETMSHHAIIDLDNNATAFGSQALGLGPGTILY
ncbi:MAG: hypothetical protein AAF384_11245 [Pseudomonadota bacterium]